jgi:hypothetical protein
MRDLSSGAGLKAAATGCRYKGYPSQGRQTNPRYPTFFRAWRRPPLEVIVAEQARRAAAQLRRTNPGLAHSQISIQPNEPKSSRPVNAILLPTSARCGQPSPEKARAIAYGRTQAANSVCSPPPAGATATLASRGGCGEGLGVGVQQTQKRRRCPHPQPLPTLAAQVRCLRGRGAWRVDFTISSQIRWPCLKGGGVPSSPYRHVACDNPAPCRRAKCTSPMGGSVGGNRHELAYFRQPLIGQASLALARFSGQTDLYSLP